MDPIPDQNIRSKTVGKQAQQRKNERFRERVNAKIQNDFRTNILLKYFSSDEIDSEGRLLPQASNPDVPITEEIPVPVSTLGCVPIAQAVCEAADITDVDPEIQVASTIVVIGEMIEQTMKNAEYSQIPEEEIDEFDPIEVPALIGYYVNAFNGYVDDEGRHYVPKIEIDDFSLPMAIENNITRPQTVKRLLALCQDNSEWMEVYAQRVQPWYPPTCDPQTKLSLLKTIAEMSTFDAFALFRRIVENCKDNGISTFQYHFCRVRGGNSAIKWIQHIMDDGFSTRVEGGFEQDPDFSMLFLLRPVYERGEDWLSVRYERKKKRVEISIPPEKSKYPFPTQETYSELLYILDAE